MLRRIATLLAAALTTSCSYTSTTPDLDGGSCAAALDAQSIPDAGQPRVWTPNQTCVLVPARIASCGLDCPFIEGSVCDPDSVLFCLWLLEVQGGDCPNDTSILRSPPCAEACR